MYFESKTHGFVYEPTNPINKPLFAFLYEHHSSLGGSRMFDDLIEVYQSQELDLKEEEKSHEPIVRAV